MASAPDIEAEIAAINEEFAGTEMDGLSTVWVYDSLEERSLSPPLHFRFNPQDP